MGGPHAQVQAENQLFLNQKTFDPWVLTSNDPNHFLVAYLANGQAGCVYDAKSNPVTYIQAGHYVGGQLQASHGPSSFNLLKVLMEEPAKGYTQSLNLRTGQFSTTGFSQTSRTAVALQASGSWPAFWKKSDIEIDGDPEAQQVTHANMFYLASSTYAGSDHSIPPMGLSSNGYGGHIFWDAEIWMFPALIAQHPDLAKSIIDYRFKLLPQAMKNAKAYGFQGAEYPWESAADGKEEAPAEFAKERHITADVAYAAWQYYLWTGDKNYLNKEGFPILSATADYWVSRVKKGPDGSYHIEGVMPPDETANIVNDDAWTNSIVQYNLRSASQAAILTNHAPVGAIAPPPAYTQWQQIAGKLALPFDKTQGMYLEYAGVDEGHLMAKQADTQMLMYPLNVPMTDAVAGKTLDYCLQHTITVGPAMTSSINAIVAARLGRAQQSLDLFRDSYRPFERGPWDAFSEKRTTDNVYFCTGMGGCLQTVLYGFAGLNVAEIGDKGLGKQIASNGDASLYCDPHLPPGWTKLVVKGVKFRGQTLDVTIGAGNTVNVAKGG
jgi:trehalose/maltose hydrolase-like predicted phosphorylase